MHAVRQAASRGTSWAGSATSWLSCRHPSAALSACLAAVAGLAPPAQRRRHRGLLLLAEFRS